MCLTDVLISTAKKGNLKTNTRIILRQTLLDIALEKGIVPTTNTFGRTYIPDLQNNLRWGHRDYKINRPYEESDFAGCIKVW